MAAVGRTGKAGAVLGAELAVEARAGARPRTRAPGWSRRTNQGQDSGEAAGQGPGPWVKAGQARFRSESGARAEARTTAWSWPVTDSGPAALSPHRARTGPGRARTGPGQNRARTGPGPGQDRDRPRSGRRLRPEPAPGAQAMPGQAMPHQSHPDRQEPHPAQTPRRPDPEDRQKRSNNTVALGVAPAARRPAYGAALGWTCTFHAIGSRRDHRVR
jgi:hypothetical protein